MAVINVHGTALARGWGRREGGKERQEKERIRQKKREKGV